MIIIRHIFLFFFLSVVIASCRSKETLPEDVVKSIERRVETGMNPGISIGIIDESGTKFFNFGKMRINGRPVGEHTIYEIGSITKVFTGLLLAIQVVEGKVSLDDNVNTFLPFDVKIPSTSYGKITLGSLSDHTSGLPRMPNDFTINDPNNPYADYSVQQMYSFISGYKLNRKVGSKYEYSNLAQGLLGHIIALESNRTYEESVIEDILTPLGMNDTRIKLDSNEQRNLAIGHQFGSEVDNWDFSALAGAGALRSSTSDLLRFLSANLGYEPTDLQSAIELTHKVRHHKAADMGVGLGWHIKSGFSGVLIVHGGLTGGYSSFIGFDKESGKGVVVLSNSFTSIDDIGYHLLDSNFKLKEFKDEFADNKIKSEILKKYIGTYELANNVNIIITLEGEQLYGKFTGRDKIKLYPKNRREFYSVVADVQFVFKVRDNETESLSLTLNGQTKNCKRIN